MLPLLPLRLHYTASAPMPLPRYSGSHWRSGFGVRLRTLACITGAPTCAGCPVRSQCGYAQVFDGAPATEPSGLNARHNEQPQPYLLCPITETPDSATVDCTLLPPAIPHLPLILKALLHQQPQRKSPAHWQLQSISHRLVPEMQWQVGQALPQWAAARMPEPPNAPVAVRLHLEHPVLLRVLGRHVGPQDFRFHTFFNALLRRIQLLHGLCANAPLEMDAAALVRHAHGIQCRNAQLHWQDWARYSARQRQTVPMGGVLGSLELHGDIAPLWSWLHLGQWLHVGKGAVMGLGRYRLEPL